MKEKTTIVRKEREKQERREEIFNAAKVIFALKGFEKATMEEIAEKAELSKGAIYLHFKSKDELFIDLVENYLDKLTALIRDIVESKKPPFEKITEVVMQIISYLYTNKEFVSIFSPERGEFLHKMQVKRVRDRTLSKLQNQTILIARVIKEGIESGVFKNIDPHASAYILFGMIHTTIAGLIIYEKKTFKKEAKLIIDMFLTGIIKNNK
ncbi:MAG: TetR/AcrR family transcriptional regulator [bacterium]|nr:TetR/AcrR family transcriptional regulator [bacterium]